jgi:hypothetical protein
MEMRDIFAISERVNALPGSSVTAAGIAIDFNAGQSLKAASPIAARCEPDSNPKYANSAHIEKQKWQIR